MKEEAVESTDKKKLSAVIEVGTTGLRLVLAELDGRGGFRVLTHASKPSRLGRDAFTLGKISKDAMRESIAILWSFLELLRGYGIPRTDIDIDVVATSALREARNRDTFVDRVLLTTGLAIRIVEDIEEDQLMYLAVHHALRGSEALINEGNSMILEVGGGSTVIMLLREGKIIAAHTLGIGVVRMEEQLRSVGMSTSNLSQFYEDNTRNICDRLDAELSLSSIKTFIVNGSDVRLVATLLRSEPAPDNENFRIIERDKFIDFVNEVSPLTTEECASRLRISWAEAESMSPGGLIVEKLILERTGATTIVVPNISIREGILISKSGAADAKLKGEVRNQVLASATALGEKYHFDAAHGSTVAFIATQIFDCLGREHGLGSRERLMLEVAGILHDIGTYIKASGHQKHGEYLVANSEIFGLNRHDLSIIANLVRYHRKGPPTSMHVNYIALPREDRVAVLKLSAILRLADSLDRSHDQRMLKATFTRQGNHFVIHAPAGTDTSMVKLSLTEKGEMFEDVFGVDPVIMGATGKAAGE